MSKQSNLIPVYQNFKDKEEAFRTIGLLRTVVDTMSNYFLVWDQEDRLVVCNDKIFELFPNTRDIYVVGRTFEEILHMGFERGEFEAPEKMTPEEWIEHRLMLHKKGEYFDVREIKGRHIQIRDQKTEDGYIISTAIDITHLKEQERELKTAKEKASQAEEYLCDALDTMSGAFMLWDEEDRLINYNKKLFEDYYPQSQDVYILGRTFEEVMKIGFAKGDFEIPKGLTEEKWIKERVVAHKNGNYSDVRCIKGRWLQIRDQRTTQGRIVTTAMDVGELKEKEQQLEQALYDAKIAEAVARQATEAKSQFLRTMSHEIRTPLQSIIQMAQLAITASYTDYKQHEKLVAILRSSESLLTILNDSLDMARIEAGKLTIKRTSFDLKQLVEGVMVMYTLPVQEKRLTFSYAVDPKLPRFLIGDAPKLRQILLNFVHNAIKFTEEGRIDIKCDVRPSAYPDRVKLYLAVTDTGPGISQEAQQKLFQEFSQTDEKHDTRLGGCGLGLSICKKMVHSLGGEIGVESEPGQGSTFWAAIDDLEPTERIVEPNWYYGHKLHTDLPDLAILLVEDNKLNQDSIGQALGHIGHDVTIVPDGIEALREIKKRPNPFDVVITDLQMPRMGGTELIRGIRALPRPYRDMPIIVLTAMAFKEDALACLKVGANRHIAKPIPMWGLQQELAKLLGYYQKTDKIKEEDKRNIYYREQEKLDDLQLIAIDQAVLQALHMGLDEDDIKSLIQDFQQAREERLNHAFKTALAQEDYDTAYNIAKDFRCISGLLGLKRLVQKLEILETSIKAQDFERIYDYYQQAQEEFQAVVPILKGFYSG